MERIEKLEAEFRGLIAKGVVHQNLAFTKAGIALGAGCVVAPVRPSAGGTQSHDLSGGDRILALLSAAFGQNISPAILEKLQHAANIFAQGDPCLASIYLAQLRIPRLDQEHQAWSLFLADRLIESGYAPRELAKALGFELPENLGKFDSDQPRDDHGRWTSGGGSGATAEGESAKPVAEGRSASGPWTASAGVAASAGRLVEGTILSDITPAAAAGLATFARSLAGPAAALGLIFVPSPTGGNVSQGALPGQPGLNYKANPDEGSLRITRSGPGGDETLIAAQLGQGGLYRDENGEPIARASGGSIIFDQDVLGAAIAQKTDEEASTRTAPKAAAETETGEYGPKLCPDPGPDVPHEASERAKAYQEQISALNNPQRPLPRGMAVTFVVPETGKPVVLDDCREKDGAMIEAKGLGYADMLKNDYMNRILKDEWKKQARSQVDAAQWRTVEWFFAEQEAADTARDIFGNTDGLKRIIVHVVPAEVK
jgi:hypothetical protein